MKYQLPNPVRWVKSDGTLPGYTDVLTSGSTYYCELGGDYAPWSAIQFVWDAGLGGTITIENTNLPYLQLKTHLAVDDLWGLPGWDPVTSAGSIVIAAGAAGTDLIYLGGGAALRFRAKIVCNGTGALHVLVNHKA